MATVTDLVPELQIMIPMAGPAQLQTSLREAIKMFMQETQVFTDRVEIHPQRGVSEYLLDIPQCRSVVSVRGVMVNGAWIRNWERDGHEDVVFLLGDYDECDCAVVDYAWTIKTNDCEVPDKIKDDYWWTVMNGALRMMHRMTGSTIVSAPRAADADIQWELGIANVKARRVNQFSNSRPRMHRSRSRRGIKPW